MSTAIQVQFEAALAAQPTETADQRAARYERALKAIAASELMGPDFGDWVQQTCTDVLDGLEAECPKCGTLAHEGACVNEEDVIG